MSQATVSKVETGSQAVEMGFLLNFAAVLKLSKHETGKADDGGEGPGAPDGSSRVG